VDEFYFDLINKPITNYFAYFAVKSFVDSIDEKHATPELAKAALLVNNEESYRQFIDLQIALNSLR